MSGLFKKSADRIKEAESLCSLATIFLLDKEKGIKFINEWYSEFSNKYPKLLRTIKGILNKSGQKNVESIIAIEIYKEAILIDPENLYAQWQIINWLHQNGDDIAAYDFYISMKSHKIDKVDLINEIPILTSILIAVGQKEQGDIIFDNYLSDLIKEKDYKSVGLLFDLLIEEAININLEKINDFIALIQEYNGSILSEFSREGSFIQTLAKIFFLKSKNTFNDEKLREAFDWIKIANKLNPENKEFLDFYNEIERDLRESISWESIKSKEGFLSYLYRRLAHRFHPDLIKNKDSNEIHKQTEIMIEINKSKNNYEALRKICEKYAIDWLKYFQKYDK